jgi:hypothetical protein
MPAVIRAHTGIAAGSTFWIDRPVMRVGSDPQCEICLPTVELPPHVATLEYRDRRYMVYNRGSVVFTLGGAVLAPGGAAPWSADTSLELPGDVRLSLEIDEDPRPCSEPNNRLAVDNDEDTDHALPERDGHRSSSAGVTVAPKKKSSSWLQLGVISICLLGCGSLLTMGSESGSQPVNRPTFEGIVTAALSDNFAPRLLIERLQYAQAALVRGDNELARSRFAAIRDGLMAMQHVEAQGNPTIGRILEYVELRLSQLR